jgi:hypothetical protein
VTSETDMLGLLSDGPSAMRQRSGAQIAEENAFGQADGWNGW